MSTPKYPLSHFVAIGIQLACGMVRDGPGNLFCFPPLSLSQCCCLQEPQRVRMPLWARPTTPHLNQNYARGQGKHSRCLFSESPVLPQNWTGNPELSAKTRLVSSTGKLARNSRPKGSSRIPDTLAYGHDYRVHPRCSGWDMQRRQSVGVPRTSRAKNLRRVTQMIQPT